MTAAYSNRGMHPVHESVMIRCTTMHPHSGKLLRLLTVPALGAAVFGATLALAQSSAPPPAAPDKSPCGALAHGFGIFVSGFTDANAGTQPTPQKEMFCGMGQLSASGKKFATADGDYAKISSMFSYSIEANSINLTTTTTGQSKDRRRGYAISSSRIVASWMDVLTAHSNKVKVLQRNAMGGGNVGLEDVISLRIHLKEDSPQCSGAGGSFHYYSFMTGLLRPAYAEGPAVTGNAAPFMQGETGSGAYLRMNACGPNITTGTLGTLNGVGMYLNLAVQVATSGNINESDQQSGDVKAEFSNVRLCIDHPKTPDDVTITSASGRSYWCTD